MKRDTQPFFVNRTHSSPDAFHAKYNPGSLLFDFTEGMKTAEFQLFHPGSMLFDSSGVTKTGAYTPDPTLTLTPSSQAAAHSDLVFFNLREELTDEFNHFEPSAPNFEKVEIGFLVSKRSQDGAREDKLCRSKLLFQDLEFGADRMQASRESHRWNVINQNEHLDQRGRN